MSPSAGTRPDAAQLVDLDELRAAYRRPPAGPVSFGTSGHRGTSLKGTFTEAHVLAISEAIVPPPRSAGDRRAAVRRPRHARAVGARVPHGARGLQRPRARRTRRRRRRLHADARAQPRDPHPPRQRRDRAHAVAQPARGRRLQVQPAERRPGGHGRSRRRIEDEANRAARRRADRDRRGAHDAARLRRRVRRRPAERDRHRRDPATRACGSAPTRWAARASRYFQAIAETPRARPRGRQRRGRPDLPLRPARPRRQDPHGLLLAVRDERADRAARPLRRRRRLRPGRRPPRDRHARAPGC